jgi:hypothetical protein
MANPEPPGRGDQLADVLTAITKVVVADRLRELFPGLELYATQRHGLGRQRSQEIWARRYPDTPLRVFPPEDLVLSPDYLLDHAKQHARIDSDRIGEHQLGVRSDSIARRVLRGLWTLQEDVLTVSHLQRCFRVPASHLVDFVVHGASVTGDRSLDGDDLFVCTHSERVIVLQHGGWVFDVTRNV